VKTQKMTNLGLLWSFNTEVAETALPYSVTWDCGKGRTATSSIGENEL